MIEICAGLVARSNRENEARCKHVKQFLHLDRDCAQQLESGAQCKRMPTSLLTRCKISVSMCPIRALGVVSTHGQRGAARSAARNI